MAGCGFDKTWKYHTDSKMGFEELWDLLWDKEKIEKQEQRGISVAIYSMFIKNVEKIIGLLTVEK